VSNDAERCRSGPRLFEIAAVAVLTMSDALESGTESRANMRPMWNRLPSKAARLQPGSRVYPNHARALAPTSRHRARVCRLLVLRRAIFFVSTSHHAQLKRNTKESHYESQGDHDVGRQVMRPRHESRLGGGNHVAARLRGITGYR